MNMENNVYSFINQSQYLKWYYNTDYEGYPVHFHHGNFFEFIVPVQGWFEVDVEGKVYHLEERDILIIPPGKLHSLLPVSHQGGRIVFMVNMDFMCLYENYSDIMSFDAPTLWLKESDDPVYQGIYQLIMKIRKEYYHQNLFRDTYIYSLIIQIFVMLSRSSLYELQYEVKRVKNDKRETFLKVQEYLKLHLQDNLTLDEVAGKFGFSKYHFSRMFKENVHMSFKQYQSMLRIEQAERLLLQDSYLKVQEIGIRCGYNSYGAFVKAFKNRHGCAPWEYVKRNGERGVTQENVYQTNEPGRE